VKIRLKKLAEGVALTCTRADGSVVTQRTRHGGFFALHDLMHYAAESVLGYREAFWGLLDAGWSFETFGDRTDARYLSMPAQALWAENLVATLQRRAGEINCDDDALMGILTEEVNAEWFAALGSASSLPLPITPAQLAGIFTVYSRLAAQWIELPLGSTLELGFPAPAPASP